MADIKSDSKTAIGIAYINASNGNIQSRVDWAGTLVSLMGYAVQVRKDKMGQQLITVARQEYRRAIEDCKQEATQLDAVDKIMGILISLGPLIFESDPPYGRLDIRKFAPIPVQENNQ